MAACHSLSDDNLTPHLSSHQKVDDAVLARMLAEGTQFASASRFAVPQSTCISTEELQGISEMDPPTHALAKAVC